MWLRGVSRIFAFNSRMRTPRYYNILLLSIGRYNTYIIAIARSVRSLLNQSKNQWVF